MKLLISFHIFDELRDLNHSVVNYPLTPQGLIKSEIYLFAFIAMDIGPMFVELIV